MHDISRLAALLCLAGFAVSCRSLPDLKGKSGRVPEPAPSDPAAGPVTLPVGTIHLVDSAASFVLIRSSRALQLEPGTLLTVHGPAGETVGQVQVSPARKGPYLTADFVSGTPVAGQKVTMDYLRPAVGDTPAFPGGDDPNAIQVLE